MFQMFIYFLNFIFQGPHLLIRFFKVKPGDAAHRLIDKLFIILSNNLPVELRKERLK